MRILGLCLIALLMLYAIFAAVHFRHWGSVSTWAIFMAAVIGICGRSIEKEF